MAKHMSEKPGIMVYFDLLPPLQRLSDREKGILFQAMLEYGKDGIEPDMSCSRKLDVVWPIMQHRLDVDDERYRDVSTRRKYAAYVRWAKKKDEAVMDYDDWLATGGAREEKTYLDEMDALA